MSQRVGATSASDAPPAPPSPTDEVAGLKHCWVLGGQGRRPGLLLQWRRTASGFQGRVVWPVPDEAGWILVEEWLPADLLEPAAADPPDGQ